MEQGLVSIITPMYNAQRYIADTIRSVQRQTYPDWEMIIMDDLSTDQSAAIVQDMALKDSRIHYFREEEKAFVAKTRNDAMAKANGRYLAFLDSDDLWEPEKLQKQMELMQQTDAAFVYGGCDVIDETGNPLGKIRHVPEHITYEKLLWGNVIPCLTVLLDQEKIGDFTMPQIGHEDYATWLSILRKAGDAYGMDEVLGHYRVNRNSVSGRKMRTIKWTWNIYRNEQKLTIVRSTMYLFGHLLQAAKKMR
jgi:teichuronic acid biosynthesis glycosyltransferase TuaG